jgi:Subtilase family
VLDVAGLGAALPPARTEDGGRAPLAAVAVRADPTAVADALRSVLPAVGTSNVLRPGTSPPTTPLYLYIGLGKRWGHAVVVDWKTADHPPLETIPWPPLPEGPGGRPVVAILDTRVEDHSWFPADTPADDPFLERPPWEPEVSLGTPQSREDRSHYGHGTFIAGLIHQHAPVAKVLSLPVMSDGGLVIERNAAKALEWLVKERTEHRIRLDVVNLSFGRGWGSGDKDSLRVAAAICDLAAMDVDVVIAAGNDGTSEITFPAGLARPLGTRITSVGSGTDNDSHDSFSSFGEWVEVWEPGRDLVSVMPASFQPNGPDEIVTWSGTSFSCAVHAGRLAAKRGPSGAPLTE